MNLIALVEKLEQVLKNLQTDVSRPLDIENGVWIADLIRLDKHVVLQYCGRSKQWGVTNMTPENAEVFMSKPEQAFDSHDQAFLRCLDHLATKQSTADRFAYLEKFERLQREGKKIWQDQELTALRAKMVNEVVVRGNGEMLQSERRPGWTHIECGIGWFQLIGDCLDSIKVEMNAMEFRDFRVRFSCVKEKLGGLRMYYSIKHKDFVGEADEHSPQIPMVLFTQVEHHIRVAQLKARCTCEDCGMPGHLRGGNWIQVLCDDHSVLRQRPEMSTLQRMFFEGKHMELNELLQAKQKQEQNGEELRIRGDGGQDDRPQSPEEGTNPGQAT